MRCNCCDRVLGEQEITFNPEIDAFEMCTTCVEIALDAAYSNGFTYDDDDDTFIYLGEDTFDDEFNYKTGDNPLADWLGGTDFYPDE
jgi:hypothetical protein